MVGFKRAGGGSANLAVHAVSGDGGNRADKVGGVDVLDVSVPEVALELVLHPAAHILQDGVPARVRPHL